MSASLKQRTIHGLFWSVIERFSVQGITFVLGVFIARLLTPADYGVIALALVFVSVFTVFIDSGFAAALIRKTDRTESDNATVFYFNIAVGLVVFLLFFLLAGPIAVFFEQPLLKPVVRVLSVTLVINSLGTVQQALLTAEINFKKQARISVTTALVSGLLGFWFAYKGFGVWALVVQLGAFSVLRTLLLSIVVGWRPRMPFSKESFREMFGFGSKILGSSLLNVLYTHLQTFLIGKFYSASALGNYSRADSYAQFPTANITSILHRVSFPVLSSLQQEQDRMRMYFRQLLGLAALIVFPVMIGLAAVARPAILFLLTDEWEGVIVLLKVLCLGWMWSPIHAINQSLQYAKGRSDLSMRVDVTKISVSIGILLIALPQGLMYICWGVVLSSLVCMTINGYYAGKLIGVGLWEQLKIYLPSLAMSLVMGAAAWFISGLMRSNLSGLIVGILTGGGVYIGMAVLFRRRDLKVILNMIKELKNKEVITDSEPVAVEDFDN